MFLLLFFFSSLLCAQSLDATTKPSPTPDSPAIRENFFEECGGLARLKSVAHGTYLAVDKDGDIVMVAKPKNNESQWIIEKRESRAVFKTVGKLAHYLRGWHNQTVDLARLSYDYEMWMQVRNKDGSWSFKDVHGGWLSALDDGTVRTVRSERSWKTKREYFRCEPATKASQKDYNSTPKPRTAKTTKTTNSPDYELGYCKAQLDAAESQLTAAESRCLEDLRIRDYETPTCNCSASTDLAIDSTESSTLVSSTTTRLPSSSEEFVLENPVNVVARVHYIKSYTNTYLRMLRDITPYVLDFWPTRTPDTKWSIEKFDGNYGQVALKTIQEKDARYLATSRDTGKVYYIYVSEHKVYENELWTPFKNDDESWSFRNNFGTWLSAKCDGESVCAVPKNTLSEHFWLV